MEYSARRIRWTFRGFTIAILAIIAWMWHSNSNLRKFDEEDFTKVSGDLTSTEEHKKFLDFGVVDDPITYRFFFDGHPRFFRQEEFLTTAKNGQSVEFFVRRGESSKPLLSDKVLKHVCTIKIDGKSYLSLNDHRIFLEKWNRGERRATIFFTGVGVIWLVLLGILKYKEAEQGGDGDAEEAV